MNKKVYWFLVPILIIILGAFFLYFQSTKDPVPEEIQLIIDSIKSSECKADGVEDKYQSCQVDLKKENDGWKMTILYDGYFDDSVKAGKIESLFVFENGQWVMVENEILYQCQPNRGHQDFSAEACI